MRLQQVETLSQEKKASMERIMEVAYQDVFKCPCNLNTTNFFFDRLAHYYKRSFALSTHLMYQRSYSTDEWQMGYGKGSNPEFCPVGEDFFYAVYLDMNLELYHHVHIKLYKLKMLQKEP